MRSYEVTQQVVLPLALRLTLRTESALRFEHAKWPKALLDMPAIAQLVSIIGTRVSAQVVTKLMELGYLDNSRNKSKHKV